MLKYKKYEHITLYRNVEYFFLKKKLRKLFKSFIPSFKINWLKVSGYRLQMNQLRSTCFNTEN